MEKYEIEKLRDLPIEEVASQLGLQVARHKSLCPFHSDHHASLSFNTRKNLCRCFVCMDESLDSIGLVMKSLHVDFPKACFWLAERNGILLEKGRGRIWRRICRSASADSPDSAASAASPASTASPVASASSASSPAAPHAFDAARYARFFEHPWLNEAACRFLFDERKIDGRVARWCRLSSWTDRKGVNWLQIPYFDKEGRLVGIQNRNLDFHRKSRPTDSMDSEKTGKSSCPTDFTDDTDSKVSIGSKAGTDSEEAPRFRFPYGSQCGIYNLQVLNLLTPGERLFITEGCSDCWAMLSAGHKAIAIPSATLLKPEDRDVLAYIGETFGVEWHMFPDRDAPGERLFLQLKEILPSLIHHQLPLGCKDFGEAYLKGFNPAEEINLL
ncbi:hypothetical protein JQM97_06690 [Prevotella hominis]|uniref:CHC2 zinc finger domain-containing protein n=1 Tax=Segatella hominis TaxID=2518605 RepID=UPI001F3F5DE4|nr:CHC2 zinc finger domain-containing protein [Segatella hominis]MCF2590629.1 hypothetical protein [Segatella hominis]